MADGHQFLGLAIAAPVGIGALWVFPIIEIIGQDLGSTADVGWIASGWSIGSAVSFSLAGSFSDIFGRKYVIIIGHVLVVIGAVSPRSDLLEILRNRRGSASPRGSP